jgi:hypothetical protein
VDFLLEKWFLPLVNCKGFPDLNVCNQRVLRGLSLHIEGGGSNFLTFSFCLIMWLKVLLCKKILSVQYIWALGISMKWISIRLCVSQTIECGDCTKTACIDTRDSVLMSSAVS